MKILPTGRTGTVRVAVSLLAGLVIGWVATVATTSTLAVLIGWMSGSLVFVGWVWLTIWPMDATATAAHASRDEPALPVAHAVVLLAAVAGLGAVATVLLSKDSGTAQLLAAAAGVLGVAVSWATVHTVFTLRYARTYYADKVDDIDFNESEPPQYSDFAYLALTIGMTYQVSDTQFKNKAIRRIALRHALLSYLLGAVVIATTINLVAGLSK